MRSFRHAGGGWFARHRRQMAVAAIAAALILAQAGPDAVAGWMPEGRLLPDNTMRARHVPPRRASAVTGSEFARRIADMSGPDREREILAEILSGNLPEFLRRLQPVQLDFASRSDRTAVDPAAGRATIWVMPDYLAVGTDADFLRVPMSLDTAATIARVFDMTLPTREMVDAIYAHAAVHLIPVPMPPTAAMTSTAYFTAHNATIERQRAGMPLGPLTAGQKKDLVLSNRLLRAPGRVAIYGWHRPDGTPIQPLSTVHGAAYADYSHGLRLVSRKALLRDRQVDVFAVLDDPKRSSLFSDEGVIRNASSVLDAAARRE